jgi:hypothetical protein
MKEHPILFSQEMVKAILAGRKTQTRRVITRQPPPETTSYGHLMPKDTWHPLSGDPRDCETWSIVGPEIRCPYGAPGDTLWVRETWAFGVPESPGEFWEGGVPWTGGGPDKEEWIKNTRLYYKADDPPVKSTKWRSGRFMPKWARRILLEVEDIRVDRLRMISEEDARAEGTRDPVEHPEEYDGPDLKDYALCPVCGGSGLVNGLGANLGVIHDLDCTACDTYKKRFQIGWDHINGKRGFAFNSNPWVWAITFRRTA